MRSGMNKYIEEVILHPLTYYHSRPSPRLPGGSGGRGGRPREVPVQLVGVVGQQQQDVGAPPRGRAQEGEAWSISKSSIGIPLFDRDDTEVTKTSKYLVVASSAEPVETHSGEFYALLCSLVLALLLNVALTCALVARPGDFDPSLVQQKQAGVGQSIDGVIPSMFTAPSRPLSSPERALLEGTLVVLGAGIAGALSRSHFLLSTYVAGALLLFLLGLQSAPFAFYYTRYIADFVCALLSLRLRSRLVTHFSAIDAQRP